MIHVYRVSPCNLTRRRESLSPCGVSGHNPKIGENQKWKFSFFVENNSMSTSFGKKFVTLQVTTKISKLLDNACLVFDRKNFSFFEFPILGYCRVSEILQ